MRSETCSKVQIQKYNFIHEKYKEMVLKCVENQLCFIKSELKRKRIKDIWKNNTHQPKGWALLPPWSPWAGHGPLLCHPPCCSHCAKQHLLSRRGLRQTRQGLCYRSQVRLVPAVHPAGSPITLWASHAVRAALRQLGLVFGIELSVLAALLILGIPLQSLHSVLRTQFPY